MFLIDKNVSFCCENITPAIVPIPDKTNKIFTVFPLNIVASTINDNPIRM